MTRREQKYRSPFDEADRLAHTAERAAVDARHVEWEEREARLDGPVSRRELLDAIEEVRRQFSNGMEDTRDIVADALEKLAEKLQ